MLQCNRRTRIWPFLVKDKALAIFLKNGFFSVLPGFADRLLGTSDYACSLKEQISLVQPGMLSISELSMLVGVLICEHYANTAYAMLNCTLQCVLTVLSQIIVFL